MKKIIHGFSSSLNRILMILVTLMTANFSANAGDLIDNRYKDAAGIYDFETYGYNVRMHLLENQLFYGILSTDDSTSLFWGMYEVKGNSFNCKI